MLDAAHARAAMVEQQLVGRGIADRRVLDAMGEVPREAFVPERLRDCAYLDGPLPIEAGQTISQPFIVGLMIEAAELAPDDRVLEVGAGSGYAAAVMSRVAARIYAIERHAVLTELARERLQRLGYDNVELRTGDGTCGWPQAAPFEAILAAAGGPAIPAAFLEQLAPGGRLVMPIGELPREQRLIKLTRRATGGFDERDLGGVMFVPLVGEHGWREDTQLSP